MGRTSKPPIPVKKKGALAHPPLSGPRRPAGMQVMGEAVYQQIRRAVAELEAPDAPEKAR